MLFGMFVEAGLLNNDGNSVECAQMKLEVLYA